MEKGISIYGAVLDKTQLKEYLEKIASDHVIIKNSNKSTFPIQNLVENYEYITKTYNILTEHLKLGITIHPAGEWLLDNYYIIEEVVKEVRKELTLKKYIKYPGIDNGKYKGYARIYAIAAEIVAHTDGKIMQEDLVEYLIAYQKNKMLTMEEIWGINLFIKIALIENIRSICEKIYLVQIEKYKVENILERYLENNNDKLKFKAIPEYLGINTIDKMQYSFIEYMAYRLKKYGKKASSYMQVLESEIEKLGLDLNEVIKREHFDIALKKVSIGNSITSIKELQRINFQNVFTQINSIEEILKKDPINVYSNMDFKTKECYLNKIKETSNTIKISEIYIAKKVLELANNKYKEYLEFKQENIIEIENNINNINNTNNENNKIDDNNLNSTKTLVNSNEDLNKVNKLNKLMKKSHVGYYLLDDGYQTLLNSITNKEIKVLTNKEKIIIYIVSIIIISLLLEVLVINNIINNSVIWFKVVQAILIFIPLTQVIIKIIEYLVPKKIKPKIIPKLDYSNGIPDSSKTLVVIPTILNNADKVSKLFQKLEVYYLANKSENIYFALLGDCKESDKLNEDYDEEVINRGLYEAQRLNEQYMDNTLINDSSSFPLFSFVYRNRVWNESENKYLGWERKRGLLNEFTKYVLKRIDNPFRINTLEAKKDILNENKIKYIITLDSDTNLILESAFSLIGAMDHILNVPIYDRSYNLIVDGYGIMQPKIGTDINVSNYNEYTKFYADEGGVDSYSIGSSDFYQDLFREGIFTGKGIYNCKAYIQTLDESIPENMVLSHDLLEGSYLRCGYVSDVQLLDDFPTRYLANVSREERWTRGDFQITSWLKNKVNNKKNPINILSKYKIFDNIRRSLNPIVIYISIMILVIVEYIDDFQNISYLNLLFVVLGCLITPNILSIINYIIFRKSKPKKRFEEKMPEYLKLLIRALISIGTIPYDAYIKMKAIAKAEYRKHISKKKMLEWTTSEDAQNNLKNTLLEYYKKMWFNILNSLVIGVLILISKDLVKSNSIKVIFLLVGILWTVIPYFMWLISKDKKQLQMVDKVSDNNKKYILDIAHKTWCYFKEYMVEDNNYLPPDNYQENRKNLIVDRTSSTNIGLGIMSIISAYDLEFINYNEAIDLIRKVIDVINKLEKWNGHLYNWYNIKTLKPLYPRYISTVDSGNFIGYMYVLKSFLINQSNNLSDNNETKEKIKSILVNVNNIINNTDFSVLYNFKIGLFSIGYNIEENKLTDSYYDLLASEARQASIVAIAKKDVKPKHFKNLSRTLTILNGYLGLISWSGTAFEYLMPNINIPTYKTTLLDESLKFMIYSQEKYSEKLGIPWGISESAFNLKDLNLNYQYKAFGIPWLGLKRGLADEMVVSGYGSVLAISLVPNKVIRNIKVLEKEGLIGKFGLYESIDYTSERLNNNKPAVVKTYMAHHQGLILASINNLINNNILQKRFCQNPEIKAIDVLLQERMPSNVIITKEKKEKVSKVKMLNSSNYVERVFNKLDSNIMNTNIIANDKYTICIDDKGNGVSKYNNLYINRYKVTNNYKQGIFMYVKNLNTKEVWNSIYNEEDSKDINSKYSINFMPDRDKFTRLNGDIESITNILISVDSPVEIRNLKLVNRGNQDQVLEVSSILEPVLSNKMQDYAHPSFNNLFLKYEFENDNIIIKRNKRNESNDIYLGVTMVSSNDCTIGELEYEIDKEKVYSSGEIDIPYVIKESIPFSKQIGLVVTPIVAFRKTLKLKANESLEVNLIISVGYDKEIVVNLLEQNKNMENIKRTFELSRVRVEEENRYLEINQTNIINYQKMLQYLLYNNYSKKLYFSKLQNLDIKISQSELWKFGISGDIPILLCIIRNIDEIYMIKEILKAHEYFKSKNIDIDIVFFSKEEISYEQYLKNSIEIEILNKNLLYMKNIKGGLFNISRNEITGEDTKVLETRADLIIDATKGNLTSILNDIEEEYIEFKKKKQNNNKVQNYKKINNTTNIISSSYNKVKQVEYKNINDIVIPKMNNPINIEELLYFNGYGGFSEDGKEYYIRLNKDNKLKNVWSNVLANENFGTVVTQNMGGYIWSENSRLNRLTVWSNNNLIDIPSEIIYLYDKEYNEVWTLNNNIKPGTEDYYITYGFGYSKYYTENLGIAQEVEIFVPKVDKVECELLKLINRTPERRKLRIVKYLRVVLGEDEIYTNKYINVQKDNEDGNEYILAKKIYGNELDNIMYVASSERIQSYTGNKGEFFGKNNIKNPQGIYDESLGNDNGLGVNSCIAVCYEIELNPYEQKKITFILGEEKNKEEINKNIIKYKDSTKMQKQLDEVKQYWRTIVNTMQIKTPIDSMNIVMNGWLIYQIIASRLFAKSGYNQSGGAIGFRDQLQDTIGLKYVSTDYMKNQIIIQSKHQFIEGDVEHWWHEINQMGIRTKFSDDLLWLPFVIIEYIKFTSDFDILNVETNYIEGRELNQNEDERYDRYLVSNQKETIFNHMLRAINKSLNFGKNGLPRIGTGDWNDGFSSVGDKGEGESIWLGFFLYDILDNLVDLLDKDKSKFENIIIYDGSNIDTLKEKYINIKESLKKKLNTNGWDGQWYKRAYTDEGNILGSIENEECRIDSIAQTWSVISNAGDNDKKYISLQNLDKYLVDKENRIIKLFDPPFEKSNLEPGYIKSYLPGVRENGGQYTHAAVWSIIANCILEFGDKAFEYFNMINPIEHSKTLEMVNKYKVEPYVIAADVYGKLNLIGRGGWTWYTGSASWYYKSAIEYILGLKIEKNYLYFKPCIPSSWKEYEIKYKYKDTMYNIKVQNPNSKNIGVDKFIFNGIEINEKRILLYNNKNVNEIIIIM